jgi:hypothetical protein
VTLTWTATVEPVLAFARGVRIDTWAGAAAAGAAAVVGAGADVAAGVEPDPLLPQPATAASASSAGPTAMRFIGRRAPVISV